MGSPTVVEADCEAPAISLDGGQREKASEAMTADADDADGAGS
jgi:hypothetical protein